MVWKLAFRFLGIEFKKETHLVVIYDTATPNFVPAAFGKRKPCNMLSEDPSSNGSFVTAQSVPAG